MTRYLTYKTEEAMLSSFVGGQDDQPFQSNVEPENLGISFEGLTLQNTTPGME